MNLHEIAERHGLIFGNCPEFPESSEQIFAAMRESVLAEREACAELCEKMKSEAWRDAVATKAHNTAASNCAAAIRARSNAALRGDSGLIAGVPLESTVIRGDGEC